MLSHHAESQLWVQDSSAPGDKAWQTTQKGKQNHKSSHFFKHLPLVTQWQKNHVSQVKQPCRYFPWILGRRFCWVIYHLCTWPRAEGAFHVLTGRWCTTQNSRLDSRASNVILFWEQRLLQGPPPSASGHRAYLILQGWERDVLISSNFLVFML